MTTPDNSQAIISLGYTVAPDGTYTATMTISGLPTEQHAQLALDHMERLFCGGEVETGAIQ